jgi:hypothetical protein
MKTDKRPYQKNPRGHVWARNDYDKRTLDIFAYEAGSFHNGPRCVNCGYGFCHHCQAGPDHDCPKAKRKPKTKAKKAKRRAQ